MLALKIKEKTKISQKVKKLNYKKQKKQKKQKNL